jgi:sugar lactone lactonase YvrE
MELPVVTTHIDRRTVLDGMSFAEGPRWHDGSLFLSDMHNHRVLRVDASETDPTAETIAQHDSALSGLGWLPDGALLVVMMDGQVLRLGPTGLTCHADLSALAPHGVNDMIVHPGGWAYVGQFGYDREGGGRPAPASLLRVDLNGTVTSAATDLLVANGMVLTPDGHSLLVAESAGRRITAFTIDGTGQLSGRRVWADLPDNHYPDGMCLDTEGAAWVACPTAGRFIRVLEGGTVTDQIPVETDRHAIACVLGGDDRRCLYLLTAATLGAAEQSRALLSARVERVTVSIAGAGRP